MSVLVQSGEDGSASEYGDGALIRLLTFQVNVSEELPMFGQEVVCALLRVHRS